MREQARRAAEQSTHPRTFLPWFVLATVGWALHGLGIVHIEIHPEAVGPAREFLSGLVELGEVGISAIATLGAVAAAWRWVRKT